MSSSSISNNGRNGTWLEPQPFRSEFYVLFIL